MFGPVLLFAQSVNSPAIVPGNLWWDYARTLLVLSAVCVAALVAVRVVLPKLAGFSGSTAPRLIQVLARQPLETKKTLYLVRAGKSVILLATSGDGVQHMATLDGTEFPEEAPSGDVAKPMLFHQIARAAAMRDRGRAE